MPVLPYLNLITSQHREQPNYIAFLTQLLERYEEGYQLALGMDQRFDLDTAVGDQLDAVGRMAGVSRYLDDWALADEEYRVQIKAAIVKNAWNGQVYTIYDLWETIFPHLELLIQDNQDMSMTVYIVGEATNAEKSMILSGYVIPKPNTVRIKYQFLRPGAKVFAWNMDNPYFGPWDEGVWQENMPDSQLTWNSSQPDTEHWDSSVWQTTL